MDDSRIPVLIGSAAFNERRDQGVAFVLDLTERKQAEAEARESERAHASLSRYFSPEVAKRLASSSEESHGMEVHWRNIAVIFTDIAGFTSLVETAAPEVLDELLPREQTFRDRRFGPSKSCQQQIKVKPTACGLLSFGDNPRGYWIDRPHDSAVRVHAARQP